MSGKAWKSCHSAGTFDMFMIHVSMKCVEFYDTLAMHVVALLGVMNFAYVRSLVSDEFLSLFKPY